MVVATVDRILPSRIAQTGCHKSDDNLFLELQLHSLDRWTGGRRGLNMVDIWFVIASTIVNTIYMFVSLHG